MQNETEGGVDFFVKAFPSPAPEALMRMCKLYKSDAFRRT